MRVILALVEEHGLREALRAAWPEGDVLLFETDLEAVGRRLVSLQVDVILVDDAPGLGLTALRPLKALAPATPIVALCSRGDLITQAAFTRAGADATVAKPFSVDTLREEIERVTQPVVRPPEPAYPRASECAAGKSGGMNQHEMALRWLSRASSHSEDPERLSQNLVEAASDIFGATRCAVVLESDGLGRVVAGQGLSEHIIQPLRLSFSSGLMRWFEEHACLLDRDAAEDLDRAGASGVLKEMRLLNARIGAPLLCGGQVFGAVFLGEKASGLPYAPEERELLALVARCVSIAYEKARAHATAVARQNRLESLLAHIHAGVVLVALNKSVVMMNPSAERLLRVRAIDTVGRSVQRLGSAFADVVLRTLADGQARLREEVREPALESALGVSVTPVGPDGVVAVFSALPQKDARAQDVSDSPVWEYLAGRIAQEIKNPMVAVNTFAQLLPKKYDSVDFRDSFASVVQEEVARINAVVETLFRFAENPRPRFEEADVHKTLTQILDGLRDELRNRSVRLETEFAVEPAEAALDRGQFSQAVENIVHNALDAMQGGGTLRVGTHRVNGTVEITIADTGGGIDPRDADQVFEPFFGTRERGMGLGLCMARRILHNHKGELNLQHSDASGSCFMMRLPALGTSHADDSGG